MPQYIFHHVTPLARAQKSSLARLITNWHTSTFRAPKFIVNCQFIDISSGLLSDTYVGGEERKINKLFISLRSGTGRTQDQLQVMSEKMVGFWDDVVRSGRTALGEDALRSVYVMGEFDSAREAGFMLPMPGKFEQWVKDNTDTFRKLASEGDVDFVGLVEEIENRSEFQREPED